MEAKLYKVNGEVQDVTPANGTDFSLEELQGFVGGYIELGLISDGRIMVLNEEGKLNGLAPNQKATEIYQNQVYAFDYVCGDVLICDSEMIK